MIQAVHARDFLLRLLTKPSGPCCPCTRFPFKVISKAEWALLKLTKFIDDGVSPLSDKVRYL